MRSRHGTTPSIALMLTVCTRVARWSAVVARKAASVVSLNKWRVRMRGIRYVAEQCCAVSHCGGCNTQVCHRSSAEDATSRAVHEASAVAARTDVRAAITLLRGMEDFLPCSAAMREHCGRSCWTARWQEALAFFWNRPGTRNDGPQETSDPGPPLRRTSAWRQARDSAESTGSPKAQRRDHGRAIRRFRARARHARRRRAVREARARRGQPQ